MFTWLLSPVSICETFRLFIISLARPARGPLQGCLSLHINWALWLFSLLMHRPILSSSFLLTSRALDPLGWIFISDARPHKLNCMVLNCSHCWPASGTPRTFSHQTLHVRCFSSCLQLLSTRLVLFSTTWHRHMLHIFSIKWSYNIVVVLKDRDCMHYILPS